MRCRSAPSKDAPFAAPSRQIAFERLASSNGANAAPAPDNTVHDRFAPLRVASSRAAPDRSLPCRSASLRIASHSFASTNNARYAIAPFRFVLGRSGSHPPLTRDMSDQATLMPCRSSPMIVESDRSQRCRSAPEATVIAEQSRYVVDPAALTGMAARPVASSPNRAAESQIRRGVGRRRWWVTRGSPPIAVSVDPLA